MKFFARSTLLLRLLVLPLALLALHLRAEEARVYRTSPTLTREIVALVELLEKVHYNHENIRPADYGQIVPDFMAEIDGQRLFFLETDKEALTRRYPASWLYNNISQLGKIDPAYDIFKLYQQRAADRIRWVFAALAHDISLSTSETYPVDRTKSPWCATPEEADSLWSRRLKFEILQEVLNKKTVDEAKQNIRKRYERRLKDLEDIESSEIAEWFLSTLTRIYDPHSTYFSPNSFEDFGIHMRLQLIGIGAVLGIEDEYCVIKEIVPGTPADLSQQLGPNDKILAVAQADGEFTEIIGMKLRKIVDMIRGEKGTRVRLVIQPADAPDPSVRREITLTRNVVNLDSSRARAAVFDLPDPTDSSKKIPVGVITLPTFYGPDNSSETGPKNSATGDVAELIDRLKKAGVKGLVLDLRNNGGGLLSEAIDLTGLFIAKGPVVQVRNYYGDVKIDSDDDPSIRYDGPLAVLVSRFSASASEIVAGALQDYGRAIIVGDSSTHGKGTVQTIIDMKSAASSLAFSTAKTGATKLTVQKFYRPDGHSTQLKGVVPDIVLPSIDEYLPIGEKDLPRALAWDEISASRFDARPLDEKTLAHLRDSSHRRQAQLGEFTFLRKNIDWFKTKQEQKTISLNLDERRRQKAADIEFRKTMEQEKERLAQHTYPFVEFNLGTPRKPAADKKPKKSDDDAEDDLFAPDQEGYARFDIHLRETLRILTDAIELGRHIGHAEGEHRPLTARYATKG